VSDAAQVASHGSFGDDEAELLEFAVDLRCAPAGILLRQTADQRTDFSGCFRSTAKRSGSLPPEEPKPFPVPADHGRRFRNDKDLGPTGADTAQANPEQPVQRIQSRARPSSLEHGELLPQGKDLDCSVLSSAEEDLHGGEGTQDEFKHGTLRSTTRNCPEPGSPSC